MRKKVLLSILVVSLLILIVFPFLGFTDIPISEVNAEGVRNRIFWQLRVPRVLIAFIAGAVLSVSGMMFQSMFRNDLATPYTLGISSGAALGAVIALKFFSFDLFLGFSSVQISSFLGALLTVFIIYSAVSVRKRTSTQFLLLTGVAVNFTCTGLIMFIQYIASNSESAQMIRWMMGSLDVMGFSSVLRLSVALLIIPVAFFLHRDLDLLGIDSEIAVTRGVSSEVVHKIIFISVSFAVALIVSETGPIGFIGLVAPHIARVFVGREHRYLIPASILCGGILLLVSDTFARTIIAPSEIPAGVITALAGGPFFLYILMRKRSSV
jgi:iron complex transport system permease protein